MKKWKIGIAVFLVLIIGVCLFLYPKIKMGYQVYQVLKSKGDFTMEYGITYKKKQLESRFPVLSGIKSGHIEGQKQGSNFKGCFYIGDESEPLFEFYRDSKGLYFNIRTTFDYIKGQMDEEDKAYKYISAIEPFIKDVYVSDEKLMETFHINYGKFGIEDSTWVDMFLRIKECSTPEDMSVKLQSDAMDFYSIPNSYTDDPLIVGVSRENEQNSQTCYFSLENEILKIEIKAEIDLDKSVEVDRPGNIIDEN